MPAETDYEQAIKQYNRDGLLHLWDSVIVSSANDDFWTPGKAFEYLIVRAFELEGAEVRYPYTAPIGEEIVEQIDGVVYADGLSCLIESKDWNESVGIEPIAKLRNQLLRRPSATIGAIFSRGGFTGPALTLAQFVAPQTILLWVGVETLYAVENMTMREGLITKYRASVELGTAYYDMRTGAEDVQL